MKNKKTTIAILGIIALVLVTIGITYAYWLVTRTQTKENVISSGCLDITLDNESNDITLTNQFPISDEEGKKLRPYTFTVTNNCNTSVDYHVNLESIGTKSSALAATTIKAMLNDNDAKVLYDYVGSDTTIDGAYEAYTLGYETLSAKDTEGSSKSYSLRLWIDANAPISEMNKTYTSKISVSVGQGVTAGGTELASLILEDAETNNYLYTTTPDFSKAIADGEYGIYSAEDDYGTSYYFRGDVENNYVKFGTWKEDGLYYTPVDRNGNANLPYYDSIEDCETQWGSEEDLTCTKFGGSKGDDMYWRIVRVNGDSSIRLVYEGTPAANTQIKFPFISWTFYGKGDYTDIRPEPYVGYTYDVDGVQTDSTIKGVVDNWYENNLKSDYEKLVSDSIFCNDREVIRKKPIGDSDRFYEVYYGSYERLITNKSPKLSCTQEADKYTVSSAKGNGLLTNPVGLLTADEVMMAGGIVDSSTSNVYLNSSARPYWTSSPYYANPDGGMIFIMYQNGVLDVFGGGAQYGVRPVISLKADVKFSGNGTIDSPYEIVME